MSLKTRGWFCKVMGTWPWQEEQWTCEGGEGQVSPAKSLSYRL